MPWADHSMTAYEHLHRYRFAREFVEGKAVLDLACGEGYGSFILSESADFVVGIDRDELSIQHAAGRYRRKNIKFIKSSMTKIPIEKRETFDIIVCFEALEHIAEHNELMAEVKRLLKRDGIFIVSTPNKGVFVHRNRPGLQNPFHVKELCFDDFRNLLSNNFKNIFFYGQEGYACSNIFYLHKKDSMVSKDFAIERKGDEFHFVPPGKKIPRYLIALATDVNLIPGELISSSYLVDISKGGMGNLKGKVRNFLHWIRKRYI